MSEEEQEELAEVRDEGSTSSVAVSDQVDIAALVLDAERVMDELEESASGDVDEVNIAALVLYPERVIDEQQEDAGILLPEGSEPEAETDAQPEPEPEPELEPAVAKVQSKTGRNRRRKGQPDASHHDSPRARGRALMDELDTAMMSTDLDEINAVLKKAEEHDAKTKSSVLRAGLNNLRQRAEMLQKQKKLRENRLRGDPPVYRERAVSPGAGQRDFSVARRSREMNGTECGQSVVDRLGQDAERRTLNAEERRKRHHEAEIALLSFSPQLSPGTLAEREHLADRIVRASFAESISNR